MYMSYNKAIYRKQTNPTQYFPQNSNLSLLIPSIYSTPSQSQL